MTDPTTITIYSPHTLRQIRNLIIRHNFYANEMKIICSEADMKKWCPNRDARHCCKACHKYEVVIKRED